jgi:hypothetical protein
MRTDHLARIAQTNRCSVLVLFDNYSGSRAMLHFHSHLPRNSSGAHGDVTKCVHLRASTVALEEEHLLDLSRHKHGKLHVIQRSKIKSFLKKCSYTYYLEIIYV